MKPLRLLLILMPFLLQSYDSNRVAAKQNDTKKWVILFNGKNLDNWKVEIAGYKLGENSANTFRVENAILAPLRSI